MAEIEVMHLVLCETVMLMTKYNCYGQLRGICQRPWADTLLLTLPHFQRTSILGLAHLAVVRCPASRVEQETASP